MAPRIGRTLVASLMALALVMSSVACTPEGPAETGMSGPGVPSVFAEQELDWVDCGGELECASATAPLDWNHPEDGRTIELALIRRPAHGPASERIGSLFMNPGGPGVSGVEEMRKGWDRRFSARLAERFDLISWDPRGVGASAPVSCAADAEEVEQQVYGIVTPNWIEDPEGWVTAQAAMDQAYLQACLRGTGDVLSYVGTDSTVRDLDLLRALVGDPALHYLGYSYGTIIGQQYLERFPERVARVVLDGVADPLVDRLEHTLEQEAGFELAIRRFVEVCPDRFGADCPLPSDVEHAIAEIQALLLRLEAAPIPASDPSDGRRLGMWAMRTAIVQTLYSETTWAQLARMLREVESLPPITDTAFQQADAYTGYVRGEGFTDNMWHAFDAITCADAEVIDDPLRLAAYAQQVLEVAPTLGAREPPRPVPACVGWPRARDGTLPPGPSGDGLPPILIVSTTGDPATPHAWGVRVADRLESGVLVTNHGEGHIAYLRGGAGGDCVGEAVDAYLLTGSVPDRDPHCGR